MGVCAGITPFNFPAMVPMWMFPVALACGNTFILKPSERDPTLSLRMAELLAEAGLPDGVFNVVHGDKEAVDAILAHPDIRAVSFVGSTPIAKYIYETGAAHGKRVQALGGAKNHAIVLPDADVPFAADAIIGAGYGSAGERCMAISAVVAVGDVARYAGRRARFARARGQGRRGRRSGHRDGPGRHLRGARPDRRLHRRRRHGRGARSSSTVASRACRGTRTASSSVRRCSTAVTPRDGDLSRRDLRTGARGRAHGVARRRDRARQRAIPYANGAALFTRSGHAARRFQEDVEVGMLGINVPIPVPMAFYSFGGWRNSLFGDLHVHGMDGVRFYTRGKAVTARWPDDGSAAPGFHMPLMG